MDFTNDFFIQAQGVIERAFRTERETLTRASGNIEFESKSDNTPVTQLDREMEVKIREALHSFDPGIGLEGEELGKEGNDQTFWLIDPIDGTKNFIRGIPEYRNIVTLIYRGQPYFTVVYKPATDELFTAAVGEGVFRNGALHTMARRPLKAAALRLHATEDDLDVQKLVERLKQRVASVSFSAEFLKVVTGELDGFVAYKAGGGPWDFAPRALLFQEAGAKVSNIGSQTYDFRVNDMLAAHPAIFDELMQIIVNAG